jgi:hypothetical protein
MMHALLLFAGLAGPLLAGASSAEPITYERPRVLVWQVQPAGVQASTAKAVEASVTRWASKNPHLEIISHHDLGNLLQAESARLQLNDIDDDRLAQIAEKADARLIIFGQVSRVGPDHAANLALFEADRARALRRERVLLKDLSNLDGALGRAANALVGRVLDLPALDLRAAAADLVDQLPRAVFVSSAKVSTVRPLQYGESTFSSPFGAEAAAEIAGAIRRRFKGKMALKEGYRLEGTYLPNQDMVELAIAVTRVAPERGEARVVFKTQQRLIRGTVDDARLLPKRLGQAERERVQRETSTTGQKNLIVDAWTEKGSVDVMFAEGETFHVYLKLNQPGYVRLVYHFADGETRVLMEDAWPITDEQANTVVRYHQTFGPAAPFGVERIEVLAFKKRPEPLITKTKIIDGEAYPTIPTTRAFIKAPQSRAEISITTTGN